MVRRSSSSALQNGKAPRSGSFPVGRVFTLSMIQGRHWFGYDSSAGNQNLSRRRIRLRRTARMDTLRTDMAHSESSQGPELNQKSFLDSTRSPTQSPAAGERGRPEAGGH